MPFPYLNTGIGDGTWSSPTLNPNTLFPSSGYSVSNGEQLLPDQMFSHSNGVAVSNAFMGNMNHNSSTNVFLTQAAPALYFPGSSTDIPWGEQTQPAAGAQLLQNFYQPPPPPVAEPLNPIGVALNAKEYGTAVSMEKALSNLSVSVDHDNGPVETQGSLGGNGHSGSDNKPKSWAAIASQPAKPKPPAPKPVKQLGQVQPSAMGVAKGDPPSWGNVVKSNANKPMVGRGQRPRTGNAGNIGQNSSPASSGEPLPVLERLKAKWNYNHKDNPLLMHGNARFFIIKSYSEDDIHRSIKYSVWTSTEHGNRRLNEAFKEQSKSGPVYLIFSVNGSGHFCGIAQMMSEVDLDIETGIWSQDKWKGKFEVKWYFVKDVPNNALRHIRLENNDNKPVTNSRDTQEIPPDKARQVVKIVQSYKHQTSIFDDFSHYEKREDEEIKKVGGCVTFIK
ncbi:hypothetical protein QZH41_006517 [Actinostola sp. cb2023]|nr:hypothetical protein QZH41_006517 [Actinostola sp. cb2023]